MPRRTRKQTNLANLLKARAIRNSGKESNVESSANLEEGSDEAKTAASLNEEEEDLAGEYRITGMTTNLEELIDAKLVDLNFGTLINDSVNKLEQKVKEEERKARVVNGIFADCEKLLNLFRNEIEQEQGIDRPELIPSGSDSDDHPQFVQATLEPSFARTTKAVGMQIPPPGTIMVTNSGGKQQCYIASITDGGCIVMRPANIRSTAKSAAASLRPQPHSRQVTNTGRVIGVDADVIAVSRHQVLRPLTTIHAPPPKQIDLVVGAKLYAKKVNDYWYRGTLIEILNKDKSRSEWKYKVKFTGKGSRVLPSKQIAFADNPKGTLPVGSRVVAFYKGQSATKCHYAGIVAETPSMRNTQRYLVFFDDGYAQYCCSKELHKVYEQSRNVWDDIHPDSREFIKSYLVQYPERPMVRLQAGQVIKTEWMGRWWTARVQVVDCSLVKMYFDADDRVEWIYRGCTRLEPLYTELANAELSKTQGKGHRRHNLNVKSNKKPLVEYLRGTEEDFMRRKQHPGQIGPPQRKDADHAAPTPASRQHSAGSAPVTSLAPTKKRSVARKSTAKSQRNESSGEKSHQYHAGSLSRTTGEMASVVQNRLANEFGDLGDEEALGERRQIDRGLAMLARKKYRAHECSHNCLKNHDDNPALYKGNNPLIIPMLCGWHRRENEDAGTFCNRQIARQKNTGKRVVAYRAPCARRLRTIEEVREYLKLTNSLLTIDLFSFDSNLHTHAEFVPIKTFFDIKDLSYGKENVPVSCVNGLDRAYPDYVEYSNQRIPAKGVVLNLETDYLVGCSCTDGCIDPNTCECAQLTIEASKASSASRPDGSPVGYQARRLMEPVFTGIYECNSRCKCDHRCNNRVAQNGIQLRLQVFKTEKRGWGLRCLDDIPAGGFICIYAGQLLTEQGANEDGQQYGDEYLAELDYIEVVERMKEGYESYVDPNIDEAIGNDQDESDDFKPASDSDSTFSGEKYLSKSGANKTENRRKSSVTGESRDQSLSAKIVLKPDSGADDQDKSWSVQMKGLSSQKQTAEWVKSIPPPPSLNAVVTGGEENPCPRTGLYAEPNKETDASGSKTDKENKSEKEDDAGTMSKNTATPSPSEGNATTVVKGNMEAESDEESEDKNEQEVEQCTAQDNVVTTKDTDQKGTLSSEDNDSDCDSLGEQKLDKPKTIAATQMSLTFKTNIPGDMQDQEAPEWVDAEDLLPGQTDGQDDDPPREETAAQPTAPGSADDNNSDSKDGLEENGLFKRTTRSQTSRFRDLPDPKSQEVISPLKITLSTMETEGGEGAKIASKKEQSKAEKNIMKKEEEKFNTRKHFGEEFCYVMDAKSMGNIGRYLNHCCAPNVFVQNVFVDTHDLRFPWVAFFAGQYIRAGTELTWDYNYDVGSVPGKVLYCYCGAAECRGRLL